MGRPSPYLPIPGTNYDIDPNSGRVRDKHRNPLALRGDRHCPDRDTSNHSTGCARCAYPRVRLQRHDGDDYYVSDLVYAAVHGEVPTPADRHHKIYDEVTGQWYETMIVHLNSDPTDPAISNLARIPVDPDRNFNFYKRLMTEGRRDGLSQARMIA